MSFHLDPFFRSRVSVVLESVDYLHLSSNPQLLIFNLYVPSFFFFSRRTFVGHGFFFNRVIFMMPADFTFARVSEVFKFDVLYIVFIIW